jgi:AraC family transcriptional regulator
MLADHKYFTFINDVDKDMQVSQPANNMVYFSILQEGNSDNPFRNFSIKYSIAGTIHYKIGNKEFRITDGTYLLSSRQPGLAFFKSAEPVKAICIDICPATIAEAFTILTAKYDYNFDNYLAGFFDYPNFFEHQDSMDQSMFQIKVEHLSKILISKEVFCSQLNKEWFLDLAQKIVIQEHGLHKAINGIKSLKYSTRKETLERLYRGKEYMDANFFKNPEIKEIALYSNLSEFHFFRCFRQAFGISPYQYLLRKRLEYATELLKCKKFRIAKVATLTGFPDPFTFSKAYKRIFGFAPSLLGIVSPKQRGLACEFS